MIVLGRYSKTKRSRIDRNLTLMAPDQAACEYEGHGKHGYKDKARDLPNRVRDSWNPNKETPRRHELWHTPRRIERSTKAVPMKMSVLYNPDTRTQVQKTDPFLPEKLLARIDTTIPPSHCQVTVKTDRSATNNRWENAKAGIGVRYIYMQTEAGGSNIALKIYSHVGGNASNLRVELGAILETLRQKRDGQPIN